MSRLSQRQYAARLGVSHVYINRLVREGKLPADADGRIDPDEADRFLAALRQPARSSRRRHAAATASDASLAGDDALGAGGSGRGDLTELLMKTRIKSEMERAKLLEIKAKVEAGKYVDVDEVRVAAFNKGRTVRDNLLNIPGRLSPLMAAESDERACYRLMDDEMRRVLEELTGGPLEE